MARVLIGARPALEAQAVKYGHSVVAKASSAADILSLLDSAAPEVVVAWCDPAVLSTGVLAACDARGIRVIALVPDEKSESHATLLGIHETVAEPAGWAEVQRIIGGSGAPSAPASPASPSTSTRGTVIAVWGPAGSPGRSTIAMAIAAELASAGHSVVLGDVDTHAASIAPSLGLLDEAPGFAAACRLVGSNSLDRAELERIGQRYSSAHGSFWVLTGLGRPARWPELPTDRVVGTITACRSWVDYVVLDTGFSLENDEEISSDLFAPKRNAATIASLREADIVVAVGAADPVGLSRFLRLYVDLVELVTTSRVVVVANKVRAAAIGLNPTGQVQQTLSRFGGIGSPVLVPHDQPALDAALLSGKTLIEVAAKSPVRVAIQELVRERILPVATPVKKKRKQLVG